MSDFYTVFDVLESNDSVAHFVRSVSRREDVLEDLDDSSAKGGREAFEDEMWVRFRDCAARSVRYVRAEDDVVQRERCRRAVGKVGDGHGCRRTSVLVEEDDVAQRSGFCA